MPENSKLPERPIEVTLYDRELGEVDLRLFNGHTGREEPHNGWIRFKRAPFNSDLAVFTDRMLTEVGRSAHRINIAWLLESPELMRKHRRNIHTTEHLYQYILTFDKKLLSKSAKYKFCPMGGSWIAPDEWALYPKSKMLSMICSRQNYLSGHKLRFKVAKRYASFIEGLYGKAFNPIDNKLEGLQQYRFSIVIENCREDFYFTEKLIDCFATGTVPIYWGCPSIGKFFDPAGIISFKSLWGLKKILSYLSESLYERMLPAIEENYRRAMNHRVVERNIFNAIFNPDPALHVGGQ